MSKVPSPSTQIGNGTNSGSLIVTTGNGDNQPSSEHNPSPSAHSTSNSAGKNVSVSNGYFAMSNPATGMRDIRGVVYVSGSTEGALELTCAQIDALIVLLSCDLYAHVSTRTSI